MVVTAVMHLGYRAFCDTPKEYAEFMHVLHDLNIKSGNDANFLSWRQYRHVLIRNNESQILKQKVLADILKQPNFKWYFITVGYDDSNITVDKIRSYSLKVANLKYFMDPFYVNEKFRKNDKGEIYIHHHTHFLVKCELPKTKVIQYVYQAVKKVVASPNFVDVKSYKDKVGSYEQKLAYIQGDKKQEKLECVELDRTWRIDNNL